MLKNKNLNVIPTQTRVAGLSMSQRQYEYLTTKEEH